MEDETPLARAVAEIRSVREAYNRRYYKLFLSKENQPVVIELWGYEEYDYDSSRWLSDEHFDSIEAARTWFLANSILQAAVQARQQWPGLF